MNRYITIVLLLINSLAFSQKAKITYVASTSNYLDRIKTQKKYPKYIDNVKNSSDIEYTLYINNDKSYYKKNESLETDNAINITLIFGGRGVYFYNLKTNETLHMKDNKLLGKDLLIKYEKIKWDLTNETIKIGKYKCLKATAFVMRKNLDGYKQQKIIAWYTPDIPLNFGPKNYNGLPGLILSLQEGDKLQLTAKFINLEPKEEIVVPNLPRDFELITFKEYEKLILKKFENYGENRKR